MKHGHGNDGLAMPASVAHRGLDLFDHRHGGKSAATGINITKVPRPRRTPRAISPRWSQWPRRTAPTPCRPRSRVRLPSKTTSPS